MKPAIALLAAVLLLAGCDKPKPAPAPPAAAPFSFRNTTPAARVSLSIPRSLGVYPVLHRKLYDEGRRTLGNFTAQAAADQARNAKQTGPKAPYERSLTWTMTADTGRLISLLQTWEVFDGGIHPNKGTSTLIWDKVNEVPVLWSQLITPDADEARLDAVLCDAVRQAIRARLGAGAQGDDLLTCPKWKSGQPTLAPSTTPGKAGGLTFHFDRSALGGSVEGEYAVTIPQSAFAFALAPAFRDQFEGAPAALPGPKPATGPAAGPAPK